jgi:tellurite resistance protein TerC
LLAALTADFLGKPAWVWLAFVGIVAALLAFDLGALHKDDHEIGVRECLLLSAGYISVALIFGFFATPRQYQHRVLPWASWA